MQRRKFIVKAGGALVAATAAATVDAPNVIAQPKIQWRMSTTWTPLIDVLQGAAQRLATVVAEITGGRFRIDVVPGGQIMPLFACFDAASQGTIEAFMGSGQYWSDREPALEFLTTIPFGMNPEGMRAWYYQGEGLTLCEETYAAFHLVPRPAMSNSPQMAGWFRRKINTIADFKGFKMRIPSLGGKVVTRAGATTVLTPGSEIYAALERGVIDASEWISPHDDMKLGLHKTARYYYYPGWHEATSIAEFSFNKKAYDALPADFRHVLNYASDAIYGLSDAEYFAKNAVAMQRLLTEFKSKVELVKLPDVVIDAARKLSAQVMQEEADKSPMAKKVSASFAKFMTQTAEWAKVEGGYYSVLS
jgi:TRAP-type mannitol/chloroaromatic compound transport system substrate-binding protein